MQKPPSEPLQPLTPTEGARARVLRALRTAIISGQLEAGTVYSAPALASQLGVSPTPVREAMLQLVDAGMAETMPNKGFRITELDDTDLDEIAQLRQLVEPPIVRDVVDVIPETEIPHLRALAVAIVDAAESGDLLGFLEHDRAFHLALLEYSNNRRIVKLVDNLRNHARLIGLTDLANQGQLTAWAREHVTIVNAIADRDHDRVYALMTGHIERTRAPGGAAI